MLVNITAPDNIKSKRDRVLSRLKAMTNAEVKAYVDKNVTTLADMRGMLTKLLILCRNLVD
jgi:hypothetical protein